MSLDDIASVTISASSAGPTRVGFGTPLIAACGVPWADASSDVVRSYASPSGMVTDGFSTHDAAYRAAQVVFSQRPRVKRVKVGKRALAFSQVVDLTPAAPASGKAYRVTVNGFAAEYVATGADNLAAVCTALALDINTEAGEGDVDAIVTNIGSTAGVQNLAGASLNGVIGAAEMDPPRSLQLVLSSHADWDATTAVVTGTNAAGVVITENFAIPNGGNATVTGTKRFATVTNVMIPAQTGTGGTATLGVRARLSASGASATKVVVTTTDAGVVTSYEDLSDTLTLKDATTNPGVATDLGAILLADADWYGLLLDSNSEAEVDAAAAWAESNNKLLAAQSADSACLDSGSSTDVAADLKIAGYGRTTAWFHPAIGTLTSWLAAGIMGSRLPANPGSDTWAYKQLRGVAGYALTDTQQSNLHTKRMGTFTAVGDVFFTLQGLVSGGEWVDVVRFIDWLKVRMQERILALLLDREKLPFTNASIDVVKGEVLAQLNEGASPTFGGIDGAQPIEVTAPTVEEVDDADKAARRLPGVEFSATLAGAIHILEITGTVSV